MDAKTEITRACKRSKDAAALSSLALILASYPFRICFVASLARPKSGSDQLFQPQRPSGLNLDASTKVCLLSTGAAGAHSSSVPIHLLSPQLHPKLTKMVGFPRLPTCFSDKYGKRVFVTLDECSQSLPQLRLLSGTLGRDCTNGFWCLFVIKNG